MIEIVAPQLRTGAYDTNDKAELEFLGSATQETRPLHLQSKMARNFWLTALVSRTKGPASGNINPTSTAKVS